MNDLRFDVSALIFAREVRIASEESGYRSSSKAYKADADANADANANASSITEGKKEEGEGNSSYAVVNSLVW
jgi:hypothetical protein